jgi:hypothetical protein
VPEERQGMAVYTAENVDAPITIDWSDQVGPGDSRQWLVTYWVGVSTTEGGSGYSVDNTCVDRLGATIQNTAGIGDGSTPSAKAGLFLVEQGSLAAHTFDIGYFSPGGALRLSYEVVLSVAPGMP